MKIIPPFSALKSWTSYDYQGHIALYIALKKIREIINKGDDITKYQLQIEGEEDFALLKDNDYLSLHQVKAGGVQLSDKDKFVFIMEIVEKSGVNGYFHINNKERVSADFCQKTLIHCDAVINDLSKPVNRFIHYKVKDDLKTFIFVGEVEKTHEKGSAYDLIKYAIESNYSGLFTRTNVVKAKERIIAELNNYKQVIKKEIDRCKKTGDKCQFYQEYHEKYDSIPEIREKTTIEIQAILKQLYPNRTYCNLKYCEFVYKMLFVFMKERFAAQINKQNSMNGCFISFREIEKIITKEYCDEINTVEYQYYQVLRGIADAYSKYPKRHRNMCACDTCEYCKDKDLCNLFNQISNLFSNNKENEISTIIHHLILFTPTPGGNNNLPSENLITAILLNLLKQVDKLALAENNIFQVFNSKNECYRVTLDDSQENCYFSERIQLYCKNIDDRHALFETNTLITDQLDNRVVFFSENNFNVLGEDELSELHAIGLSSASPEEMRKEANRLNLIRLINKNTAIGELK